MNWFFLFLKGFAMGAANVVPGVSGGTVAFVTGIYERLINAIKAFDISALTMLRKRRIGDFLRHIDFSFLAVLGLGVVVSVFSLAKLLDWAYANYEVFTASLFFGLIALSILSVAKMVKKWGVFCILGMLLGCGVAISLAFVPQAEGSTEYWYLGVCGAAAMCSMILPGVSGSFVLLLMGNYLLILNSVNDLSALRWGKALPIIIPVGIGAVIGVAVLSRLLSWLFKKYHDLTTAIITGFVAGSLYIIWPWKKLNMDKSLVIDGEVKGKIFDRFLPELNSQETWTALSFILIGALLMWGVDFLGKKKPVKN